MQEVDIRNRQAQMGLKTEWDRANERAEFEAKEAARMVIAVKEYEEQVAKLYSESMVKVSKTYILRFNTQACSSC